MQSTRSSGEETEPRYTSGLDSETNTALHGQKKEAEKLELGHPESEAWASSFGEGELENLKIAGSVDPVFEAKSAVINSAFQHIGMGAYQWKLFALCGFGWVYLSWKEALTVGGGQFMVTRRCHYLATSGQGISTSVPDISYSGIVRWFNLWRRFLGTWSGSHGSEISVQFDSAHCCGIWNCSRWRS